MVLDADLTTPRCLRTRLSQSKAVAQRVCRTAPSSPQPFYLFLFYFARNARANLALDWGEGRKRGMGGYISFWPFWRIHPRVGLEMGGRERGLVALFVKQRQKQKKGGREGCSLWRLPLLSGNSSYAIEAGGKRAAGRATPSCVRDAVRDGSRWSSLCHGESVRESVVPSLSRAGPSWDRVYQRTH